VRSLGVGHGWAAARWVDAAAGAFDRLGMSGWSRRLAQATR
jgi:hypothetical protein